MVQFSKILDEDLHELVEIYNWYIDNSTATFHLDRISVKEFKSIIFYENKNYGAYSIKLNNEISGYCLLVPFKSRAAYNRTVELVIYLKPGITGKGIGSSALSFLMQKATEKHFKMMIACITANNAASIKLFEKAGFEQCAYYKQVGEKFGEILDVVNLQKEV